MVEVGNGPDFDCAADAAALARCQAHFTLWTIMKAPLIVGNNLSAMDGATLSVLGNREAIAVNQDPLGVQARRVAVQPPRNATLTASAFDNIAVVQRCSPAEPTQRWTFVNASSGKRDGLYLVPCDAADPYQQWQLAGGALRNVGAAACVDASGRPDPGQVLPCVAASPPQQWAFLPTGQVRHGAGMCLDVFNFAGPDVFFGGCKKADDPCVSPRGGLLFPRTSRGTVFPSPPLHTRAHAPHPLPPPSAAPFQTRCLRRRARTAWCAPWTRARRPTLASR